MAEKVAIITQDYTPATGGVSVYWQNLLAQLPEEFVVVAPKHKQETLTEERVLRIPFFYKPVWPHWIGLLLHLPYTLLKYGIRSVIVGQVIPVGTVVYILYKLGFLKYYGVSVHGMDVDILHGRKRKLALLILKHAEYVIANSKLSAQKLIPYGIAESEIVIVTPAPNTLPTPMQDVREYFEIGPGPILLSVGRLVERKGVDMVLRALPSVFDVFPETQYVVVGDGQYRIELATIMREHIPEQFHEQVHFLGRTADDELAGLYEEADMFVLPTRVIGGDTEGFGIVNIEASSYGLPVIAGEVSSLAESVLPDTTGLIVDSSNTDEVAKALIRLLQDEFLRTKLGQQGRQYAQQFSWKASAEKLQELF